MKPKKLLTGALVAAMLLVSSTTSAQPTLIRLGLDTEVFGLHHHFGGDHLREHTRVNFLLGQARLGFIVGAKVWEGLFIGGRLALGVTHDADARDHWTATTFGYELQPIIEYIFLDGMIQPYVHFVFGIGGEFRSYDHPDHRIDEDNIINAPFLLGGGIHLFPNDSLSVDLGLQFGYTLHVWDDLDPDHPERHETGGIFSVMLIAGVSGWL